MIFISVCLLLSMDANSLLIQFPPFAGVTPYCPVSPFMDTCISLPFPRLFPPPNTPVVGRFPSLALWAIPVFVFVYLFIYYYYFKSHVPGASQMVRFEGGLPETLLPPHTNHECWGFANHPEVRGLLERLTELSER